MKAKLTFTDAQREMLKPYEQNFKTAVFSDYARRVGGPEAAYEIGRIYREATGVSLPVYPSCQDCMLRLLKQVGKAYFADLDLIAIEALEKAAKKVVDDAPEKVVVTVTSEELEAAAKAKTPRKGRVKTSKF